MKRNERISTALMVCAAGILMSGCGTNKQVAKTEIPAEPTPSAIKVSETKPTMENYLVQKGDCLWNIAAKSQVYGDAFMWPLLFKANRDHVQDPDLIYPRQNLSVDKSVTGDEKQRAKKLAAETPKYVPHDKPVSKLPLDYF